MSKNLLLEMFSEKFFDCEKINESNNKDVRTFPEIDIDQKILKKILIILEKQIKNEDISVEIKLQYEDIILKIKELFEDYEYNHDFIFQCVEHWVEIVGLEDNFIKKLLFKLLGKRAYSIEELEKLKEKFNKLFIMMIRNNKSFKESIEELFDEDLIKDLIKVANSLYEYTEFKKKSNRGIGKGEALFFFIASLTDYKITMPFNKKGAGDFVFNGDVFDIKAFLYGDEKKNISRVLILGKKLNIEYINSKDRFKPHNSIDYYLDFNEYEELKDYSGNRYNFYFDYMNKIIAFFGVPFEGDISKSHIPLSIKNKYISSKIRKDMTSKFLEVYFEDSNVSNFIFLINDYNEKWNIRFQQFDSISDMTDVFESAFNQDEYFKIQPISVKSK